VTTVPTVSAWVQIGGAPTVKLMVGRIYHLIKFDDEIYLRYFAGHDLVEIQAHMAALLTKLLGGPDRYTGRDLAEAHAGLNITNQHYNDVGDYVISALWSVHAGPEVIAAVSQTLEEVRRVIVVTNQ
jgi:hemoglobin